ncbi:MAG: hypothetical protein SW833_05130 [Cyanobacteriota bacterium]|nr:hypothetical protein [Cyanobacteriota bacterium]
MSQQERRLNHEQLSDCTSRLWTIRSFLSVLHSALLYDQQELADINHEMLYDDVLKNVMEELLDIICTVDEVENALSLEFKRKYSTTN